MIPRKHHFWSFLAITIAVFQIMILILIPLQNEHDGMGKSAKHTNFIQSGNHSWKIPIWVVFGYNNSSVSNPNDFNTHTSSKSTCWNGDMRKSYKYYSEMKIRLKLPSIFVVFGFNNWIMSNPNDFYTHTSSK